MFYNCWFLAANVSTNTTPGLPSFGIISIAILIPISDGETEDVLIEF
jgi:hypothetical protein